jgi:FdhD protein
MSTGVDPNAARTVPVRRWNGGGAGAAGAADDQVVTEEPLEIRIRREDEPDFTTVAITMRTPGHDEELALGFLYGEGILADAADVVDARVYSTAENVVQVVVRKGLKLGDLVGSRRFYTTSSCGLCGRSSLEAVARALKGRRVAGGGRIAAALLATLPERLRAEQRVFAATGGLHGCALFDYQGRLLATREDVGRHNGVDKLVGHALRGGTLPWTDRVLMLSGRAGFELVQKAAMAGCSVVAAVGAPSSLAVELAVATGMTLAGFVGATRLNAYAGSERITF